MNLLDTYNNINCQSDKESFHKYISNFYEEKIGYKKNDSINILEIGIQYGHSLKLWQEYFNNANIYGFDINNQLTNTFYSNVSTKFFNAYSDEAIEYLKNLNIKFDIIIDDGPHTLETQDYVCKNYKQFLNDNGLFVVEDVNIYNLQTLQQNNPEFTILNLLHIAQCHMDNIIMYVENINDNSNTFEILNKRSEAIENIGSAWKGHRIFAENLVKELKPKIVVDLGVDWGYSSFCLSNPNIGKVYAVDLFTPNAYNSENTFNYVNNFKDLHGFKNLEFIKSDFCDLVKEWKETIDILHIDGWHSYEEVKRDFDMWSKLVSDNGVILMHDTEEMSFGVRKFFDEIQLPKFNFTHSSGLGVVCKNSEIFDRIKHLLQQ